MTMSVDIKALTMSMKCFSKEEAGTSHYEKYNFPCESKVFSTGEAEANELLPCGMRRHVPGRGDRSLPSPGLPQHKTGLKQWKFTPGPRGRESKIGVSAGSHCLRRLQGSTCLRPLPWLVAPGPLGDRWLGTHRCGLSSASTQPSPLCLYPQLRFPMRTPAAGSGAHPQPV